MRPALALPIALILACGPVPDITFSGEDASASADGSSSAEAGDDAASAEDGDPSDANADAGPYCSGNAPPPGGKCCPNGGPVCFGTCSKNSCSACGDCPYPKFCCTLGVTGTCQSAACGGGDGSGG